MRSISRLRIIFVTLGAALLGVLGTGAASAQVGTSVNTVTLQAKHSGKCVDVEGWSLSDGAKVHQWTCHGQDNQRFDLVDTGDPGYFNLVGIGSGKCLDVEGPWLGNGVRIHQWTCHGGDNQKFKLSATTDGYYNLVAKHSGKCVDVWGWSQRAAQIQQWDCSGADNQKFTLGGDDGGFSGQIVALRPKHTQDAGADKCIDIEANSQAAGARVQLWGCNAAENQRFRMAMTPRGGYRFVAEHSGHFLSNWSTSDGAWINQWTSFAGANQTFTLRDAGGGYYELVSDLSNKCVAVASGSQSDGAQVHQWPCTGAAHQKFALAIDADAATRARHERIGKAYRPRLMLRNDQGCNPLPFTNTYDHKNSCKSTFDAELAVFASVKDDPSGRAGTHRVTYGVAFGKQPGFYGGAHGYDAQYLVVDVVEDVVTSVWADLHQGYYARARKGLSMDGDDHVKVYVGQYFNSLKLESMTTGAIWENWGDPTGSDRQESGRLVMVDDVCRAPAADYRSADGKVYNSYDRGKLADYVGCDNAANPWKNDDDKLATFRSKNQYTNPYGLDGCKEGETVWADIDWAGADICNAAHFPANNVWHTSRAYKNAYLDGFVAGATYVDYGAGQPFSETLHNPSRGRLKKVTIRTGARVDAVQTAADHLTSTIDIDNYYGGDGGSAKSIDGLLDDPIVSVELCTARKNTCVRRNELFGNCLNYRDVARVGHIKLITRNGDMIQGGDGYEGCTTIAPSGKQLLGFYGREGDEIDMLGTIWGDL